MSCRSAIYTANTNTQTIASGGAIQPGNIIRRFGQNINLQNDSIVITGSGYYDVDAAFTVTATNPGTISIYLTKDGTAIPGAVGSASVVAADVVTISVNALVREFGCCCDNSSSLAFVLSGAAETITNAAIVIERI